MLSTMQDVPLLISRILTHGSTIHGSSQVTTWTGEGEPQRAKLAAIGLTERFPVFVASAEVGMRKPNPAIYLHALDLLGDVSPDQAVLLDDSPGNVAGARRAGLHAIHVVTPAQALAELDELLAP